jgi:single-stranded-DNA-specific exonuclease
MRTSRPIVTRTPPDPQVLAALSELDPISARVFAARGVSDPGQLDYALSRLAPVSLLENVDAAVDLLVAKRGARILIVGDFDVDGATSAALLMRCMREFGFAEVGYIVPNRFEFGYGLTPEIVRIAAESSPALLVTVDNGISSLTGVEEANKLGIPVLVTDHHLPGGELPDAAVIVNPNLPGSRFPSRNLAGVGVAFYLMAALGCRPGTSTSSRWAPSPTSCR